MAIIHWWLLQLTQEEAKEFTKLVKENYETGMSVDEAHDAAGEQLLGERGDVPGQKYLWGKPKWADAETSRYEESK